MILDKNGLENDFTRWKKYYISSITAKGNQKNTICLYSYNIDEFIGYIINFTDLDRLSMINKQIIEQWVNYFINEVEMEKSTAHNKLIIIKSFFMYITSENEDLVDISRKIADVKIKVENKEKDGYIEKDIEKVLNHLEKLKLSNNKKLLNPYIKNLYFKLFYYTGIRAAELLTIKYSDIIYLPNEKVYKIKVLGKGQKDRFVYILSEYIEDELENIPRYSDYICTKKSKKLYITREIYSMFESFFTSANVRFGGLHKFRHTFARRLVSNDTNLTTIQELLGHADIQTTAKIYAKTNENNKIKAMKNIL
jgi:integrase